MAEAVFSLYDCNGDGYISIDEMTRYLYETEPGTEQRIGVAVEDLAKVIAEEAFEEAGLNHDGRLSFDEFKRWYTLRMGQASVKQPPFIPVIDISPLLNPASMTASDSE